MSLDTLRLHAGTLTTWALVALGLTGFVLLGSSSDLSAVSANVGTALVLAAIAGGIARARHVITRRRTTNRQNAALAEELLSLREQMAQLNRRVTHIEAEQLSSVADELSALRQVADGKVVNLRKANGR